MKQTQQVTITRGLAYLAGLQAGDGACGQSAEQISLPAQALILIGVSSYDQPAAGQLRQGVAKWILARRHPDWIFGKKGASDADVEEAFYSLVALQAHDPSLIDTTCLAHITQFLIANELQPGGPYRTTVIGNALIARFLRRIGATLPVLDQFLRGALSGQTDLLTKYHLTFALDMPLPFVGQQQKDGSWPAIDQLSSTMTTAIALAILAPYSSPQAKDRPRTIIKDEPARRRVLARCRAMIGSWPRVMKPTALTMLAEIERSDNKGDIILLPQAIAVALCRRRAKITDAWLARVGAFNVCIWLAYTVLDDFLDGEGQPNRLPVALAALRHIDQECVALAPTVQDDTLTRLFAQMDQANFLEVTHARHTVIDGKIEVPELPDYGMRQVLFERSIGLAAAPLIILAAAGYPPDGSDGRTLINYFKHYLIVRQLNDDLHDWQEDLLNGQTTYVVATLFAEAQILPGQYPIDDLLPQLQQQFWFESVGPLCQMMRQHLRHARRYLHNCHALQAENGLSILLDDTEASIDHTLEQQAHTLEFMAAYDHTSQPPEDTK